MSDTTWERFTPTSWDRAVPSFTAVTDHADISWNKCKRLALGEISQRTVNSSNIQGLSLPNISSMHMQKADGTYATSADEENADVFGPHYTKVFNCDDTPVDWTILDETSNRPELTHLGDSSKLIKLANSLNCFLPKTLTASHFFRLTTLICGGCIEKLRLPSGQQKRLTLATIVKTGRTS